MSLEKTVESLLDRFGVGVTVLKRSITNYSPVADVFVQANSETSARCVVINKSQARVNERESNSVQSVLLFFGPSPVIEKGDRFMLAGKMHSIETVQEFARSGVVVGYKVQATR